MAPCFRRALFEEESAGHGSTARAAVVVVVTRKKCYPVPACASWCPASHRWTAAQVMPPTGGCS